MNTYHINDFSDYLKIEGRYSEYTVSSYITTVDHFSNFINKDLTKVKEEDIKKYLKYLTDKNLRSNTISNYITALKEFYKFLMIDKVINENPLEFIDTPKLPKMLPKYLTQTEIENLLNISLMDKFDYRNKAMLELLYDTGIRVGELVNIKMHDIDLINCSLKIFGKGSKERLIPLGDISIKYIRIYINEYRNKLLKNKSSDYLFISNLKENITRERFYEIIKKIALKQGIKTNVSPHVIRHTFATHLLDNNADLKSIQELLGHSNISTTQIYTHVSTRHLRDSYNNAHPHGKRDKK